MFFDVITTHELHKKLEQKPQPKEKQKSWIKKLFHSIKKDGLTVTLHKLVRPSNVPPDDEASPV